LRPDGFAGYEPEDASKPATIITTAFRASKVGITADVSAGGSIQIKALDDQNVLLDEAEAITGDVTDAELKWKHGAMADKDVHFEIQLNHGRIYALTGVDLIQQEPKETLNKAEFEKAPARLPTRRILPPFFRPAIRLGSRFVFAI